MRVSLNQLGVTARLLMLSAVVATPGLADDPFASLNMSRLQAGNTAASFELAALDGKIVKSSEFAGKVVLVNFWATWCGPCKEEMPSLARLQRHLDPTRFVVLTITADRQRDGIKAFLKQLDVTVPVLFDEDQEVSRSFMVRGLPTTIVVDPNNKMIGRAVGPRRWDSPEAIALLTQVAGLAR